ncbi:sensor histidine kinase [Kocuria sp.]|uniref:sensor histidine kinase n=1 Tax=Kocuria sp. TaxID=1871328 RepID=UPI0026DFD63F|nr:histidine kinase N-terminal domain-containing protein [Kocuria sp.]MDO5619590.1 histidine kinase N-terminal domain-containing protein [Kocuria sp.]
MPLTALQGRPEVTEHTMEYLHLLLAEWQILADLGMGDVLLTVPEDHLHSVEGVLRPVVGTPMVIAAHTRPATAQTAYVEDLIGRAVGDGLGEFLREAWENHSVSVYRDRHARRQVFAVPIVYETVTVAVLSLHAEMGDDRLSGMDLTYRDCAMDLMKMALTCQWPASGVPTAPGRGAPRVGDGVICLTAQDCVRFMSPNAVSALNRVGSVAKAMGESLTDVVGSVLPVGQQVDEVLMGVLRGRVADYAELRRGRTAIMFRSIPVRLNGERTGAIILCRDVSELRRRERELSSKDATIRETHHRVKNSLQTVAALLRMQARRADTEDEHRALAQAMRRVDTVALVHDALSETPDSAVDFDAYFARQLRTIVDLAKTEVRVTAELQGQFGEVPGHLVTPLALVLNEVVTNAVEHGLAVDGGNLTVTAHRRPAQGLASDHPAPPVEELVVVVEDDGVGLPADFPIGRWAADQRDADEPAPRGLGTRIVRNLVLGELDGSISWARGEKSGTVVETTVPLYLDPVAAPSSDR